MNPEVNAAMSRVAVAMEEHNERQVGLRIPYWSVRLLIKKQMTNCWT